MKVFATSRFLTSAPTQGAPEMDAASIQGRGC